MLQEPATIESVDRRPDRDLAEEDFLLDDILRDTDMQPQPELFQNIDDSILFPGFSFSELKPDNFNGNSDAEERVSKVVESSKTLKTDLLVKKQNEMVKRIWSDINQRSVAQKSRISELTDELQKSKTQSKSSKEELERIETELLATLKSRGYNTITVKNHELELPRDPGLQNSERYRYIVLHHSLHLKLYNDSQADITALKTIVMEANNKLEDIIVELTDITPQIQIIKDAESKDREKLLGIAQKRTQKLASKKKELEHLWKSQDFEIYQNKVAAQKKKLELENLKFGRNEKMAAFYKHKKEVEAMILPDPKLKTMEALQVHFAKLKKMKTLKHAKKESPKKLTVEERTEQEKLAKSVFKETRKNEILAKVLHQEYPDVVMIPKKIPLPVIERDIKLVEYNLAVDNITVEDLEVDSSISSLEGESLKDPLDLVVPMTKKRVPIPLVRVKPAKSATLSKNEAAPFIMQPALMDFKDVVANETYSSTMLALNASSSPKYFRFVKISEDLVDYLSVTLESAGYMCSGAECKISIVFKPSAELLNGNIVIRDSVIQFQSSCGTFVEVDFKFSSATCSPSFDCHEVTPFISYSKVKLENILILSFEDCVVGDSRRLWVKLINNGSVPTEYSVSTLEKCKYEPETIQLETHENTAAIEKCLKDGPFIVRQRLGMLGEYGNDAISVTFKPTFDPKTCQTIIGNIKALSTFSINFGGTNEKFFIQCNASTRALNLYPDRQVVDFKCCTPDLKYQDSIQLWNNQRITRKFRVDSCYPKFTIERGVKVYQIPGVATLEVSPASGFIQPHSSCQIRIKLKFLKDALFNLTDNMLFASLKFYYLEQATGKERYTSVDLKAELTTNLFTAASDDGSTEFDFGEVSIFEKKHLLVTFYNPSKFEQIISYPPSGSFNVQPEMNDSSMNVFNLKPNTTVKRYIAFEPKLESGYNSVLKIRNIWGVSVLLNCKGLGISPPASFLSSLINFEPIPYGSISSQPVILSPNIDSSKYVTFEFKAPILLSFADQLAFDRNDQEYIGKLALAVNDTHVLSIWPSFGVMNESDIAYINVSASILSKPKLPVVESKLKLSASSSSITSKASASKKDSKKGGKLLAVPQKTEESVIEAVKPAVTLSQFEEALMSTKNPILSFLVPCLLKTSDSRSKRNDFLRGGLQSIESPRISTSYLKVVVPITDARAFLVSPENGSCFFGNIFVGRKSMQTITIQNYSQEILNIKLTGLSPVGCFYLRQAVRPIAPNESGSITVVFQPTSQEKYFDSLQMFCFDSKFEVKLAGDGVSPAVQVDAEKQIIFENTCVGDSISNSITLKNVHEISLDCIFSLASSDLNLKSMFGSSNQSGSSPFSLNVFKTTILPGALFQIPVIFTPDREHANYFDTLIVLSDSQPDYVQYFQLRGRAWEFSSCVLYSDEHPTTFKVPDWVIPQIEEYTKELAEIVPPTAVAVKDAKKEKKKKEEPSINAEVMALANKRGPQFATINLEWKQFLGSELPVGYLMKPERKYWRLDPKDVTLSNLKPTAKDGVKKGSVEYSIEKCAESFYFDVEKSEYVLTAQRAVAENGFDIAVEIGKGSIEMGTSKAIPLLISDPVTVRYNNIMAVKRRESKAVAPSKSKDSSATAPATPIQLSDKELSDFSKFVKETEIKAPVEIEQVFKVSFKSSIRFVEPKGPQFAQESRVFYVKVQACRK